MKNRTGPSKFWVLIAGILVGQGLGLFSAAAEQPKPGSYIESVSQGLEPKDNTSFTQKIQEDLAQKDTPEQKQTRDRSFIEEVKASGTLEKTAPKGSFIEEHRAKIEETNKLGIIEPVKNGSEVRYEVQKKGNIHSLYGFKYGIGPARDLSGGSADFNSLYGSQYAPEFSFYYEYQPFHSEIYGNIGIMAMAGLGYYRGNGQFGSALTKPNGLTGRFDLQSLTKFTFVTVPLTLAIDYRLNLLHFIRPYALVGPTGVLMFESRDDGAGGQKANAKSLLFSVGASFLLDWISRRTSWEQYQQFGFHHYYLVVDYTRVVPLVGDIRYGSSGLSLGLAIEM